MQFIKASLLAFTFLFSLHLSAQVEVPNGTFPFDDIIEWEGHGTLLLGEDPTGSSQEINFNLFNNEGEVVWNRSVYPKSKKTHLIVSGTSNYLYFVDDLAPVNNQIRYNQVSQSGNVITTKFEVLSILRKHGYTTPNDLELKEIVNTPKALVFYFQLPVKSEGLIENFFITITHHNNRVYYLKTPAFDIAKSIDEQEVYNFAGADEEEIRFSNYATSSKGKSINFLTFSPKAELLHTNTLKPSGFSPLFSEVSTVDLNGSYYLNEEVKGFNSRFNGQGITFQGQFYYFVNDAKDVCLKIYGLNERSEFVILNECKKIVDSKKKPNSSLTFFYKNDALYVLSTIDRSSIVYKISNGNIQLTEIQGNTLDSFLKNPSSFKVNQNIDKFVHYINGIPYYLDRPNLKKQDKVIFKKL